MKAGLRYLTASASAFIIPALADRIVRRVAGINQSRANTPNSRGDAESARSSCVNQALKRMLDSRLPEKYPERGRRRDEGRAARRRNH